VDESGVNSDDDMFDPFEAVAPATWQVVQA